MSAGRPLMMLPPHRRESSHCSSSTFPRSRGVPLACVTLDSIRCNGPSSTAPCRAVVRDPNDRVLVQLADLEDSTPDLDRGNDQQQDEHVLNAQPAPSPTHPRLGRADKEDPGHQHVDDRKHEHLVQVELLGRACAHPCVVQGAFRERRSSISVMHTLLRKCSIWLMIASWSGDHATTRSRSPETPASDDGPRPTD